MPDVRQVTLEFPLEVLSQSGFPIALIRKAQSLRFLHQDFNEFQISCKVQMSEVSAFKKEFREQYRAVRIERLYRDDKDGLEALLIRGRWAKRGRKRGGRGIETLRSLARCEVYLLRSPEIVGEKLRVSIGGEQAEIGQMLREFAKSKVPYRVAKLAKLAPNIGPTSPLDSLTMQQMRILRLAHGLGYYHVPRRTSTKELSKLLKMDKGTTGEHIRRAEKHVMDHLLA